MSSRFSFFFWGADIAEISGGFFLQIAGRFWCCKTGVAITDGPNIKVCKARVPCVERLGVKYINGEELCCVYDCLMMICHGEMF